ncbi:hypothetical protein VPHD249_0174 [Vibrio phage D249]|nr:hypothetical protein SIPHO036v1_50009 [Vibrio phage 70E38.1]QZI88065.1 hypothetical protein SIPHO041v1_p0154 [Vibrio phage 234P1]QZI88239.1 hypothetical protein SIPHO035v1_p0148 [Vibrio phage 234P7B]QZI88295.1 hypothetical protein SIPHO082v1_p0018 [Vibrio phage 294E48.1]QZI88605.1 hypothetical protein SIPHO037v1_p0164 [Vibrio phage 70E35.2]QZI88790.1 hypothetical protein SIPHO039v1_p0161 [Vibrio phage 70E35.5a]QZI88973.1 hypothetical protein SIPHO040v1_p0160 [Vibrio phage 70E35.6]QZI89048
MRALVIGWAALIALLAYALANPASAAQKPDDTWFKQSFNHVHTVYLESTTFNTAKALVYQNRKSGNCYIAYSYMGMNMGSLSPAPCEDWLPDSKLERINTGKKLAKIKREQEENARKAKALADYLEAKANWEGFNK